MVRQTPMKAAPPHVPLLPHAASVYAHIRCKSMLCICNSSFSHVSLAKEANRRSRSRSCSCSHSRSRSVGRRAIAVGHVQIKAEREGWRDEGAEREGVSKGEMRGRETVRAVANNRRSEAFFLWPWLSPTGYTFSQYTQTYAYSIYIRCCIISLGSQRFS